MELCFHDFYNFCGDEWNWLYIERVLWNSNTVKYDNNNAAGTQTTAEYQTAMKSGTTVATYFHNHASAIASASGFGFEGLFGKITSVAYNEANAMMVDVSTKFFASSSGNVLQVVT